MCRHAIRRVEAVNWQKTVLVEKKMNNVAEKLTKKLDMKVALRKAKGRSKRLGESQGGYDPRYETVKEKGEAVREPNCTHEPRTPIRIGEGEN